MLIGRRTRGSVWIPLGELEHLPVVGFKFLSSGRILRNVELGKVAAARDADTCESRRNARCADRGVRPTRGPAEDAEADLDDDPRSKRGPSQTAERSNEPEVTGSEPPD